MSGRFGCGANGDALGFVMRTEGLTLPEAAARLGGVPADPQTKRRLAAEQKQREQEVAALARCDAEVSAFYDRHPASPIPDWALDVG